MYATENHFMLNTFLSIYLQLTDNNICEPTQTSGQTETKKKLLIKNV